MNHWLLKSEPSTWSWHQQCQVASEPWTGVRNYQARNFLKAMRLGDLAFFYHSVTDKKIMGIVEVVQEFYPDPTDEKLQFVCVDVKATASLKVPVSLAQIKADPRLENLPLIRQSRLSVMPLSKKEWDILCKLGKTEINESDHI
jgi:predicted RNA-binding protein with PUA-like domain